MKEYGASLCECTVKPGGARKLNMKLCLALEYTKQTTYCQKVLKIEFVEVETFCSRGGADSRPSEPVMHCLRISFKISPTNQQNRYVKKDLKPGGLSCYDKETKL